MLIFRHALYLMAAALLAACQTDGRPALSLEEAKQVTASFKNQSFVAPPRTISDVMATLDEATRVGSHALRKIRATANANPPPISDREKLATFYVKRGESARLLGRHRQGVEDAEKALSLSSKVKFNAYRSLSFNHEELGNYSRAADFAGKALKAAEGNGNRMASYALYAVMLAHIGDFDGAEDAISTARSMVSSTYGWRGKGAIWAPLSRNFVALLDGQVAYLRGAYSEAEAKLREVHRAIEDDIAKGANGKNEVSRSGSTLESSRLLLKAYALRALGQSLMRQERLAEAEVVARGALVTQARFFGRDSGQTAEGVSALMEILVEQSRFAEAATLARATADILEKMGANPNSMTLGVARRSLMNAEIGQSRWTEATQIFDRITHDLGTDSEGLSKLLTGDLTWALALIRMGRESEVVERIGAIHKRLQNNLGAEHYATAEALALLGSARAAAGNVDGALADLSRAAPVLLSRQHRLYTEESSETGRRLMLRFILESYLAALWQRAAWPAGDAAISEAFRIANFIRTGSVERALGASAARTATKNPELADLARREQDALYRIAALNGRLADAAGGTKALLKRIGLLKSSRRVIMAEITTRFPDYAQLIDPKPATVDDARAALRSGEALIATYVGEGRTYVWAVPKVGPVAFSAADIGHDDLANTIAILRAALEPNAATLGEIPAFDLSVAHDLYKMLLGPVETGWKDATSLLVVAHGPLGYLPFSVLPVATASVDSAREPLFSDYRRVPWLARTHAVTVLPSISSLQALRGLPPGDPRRKPYIGFGDPWFNNQQAVDAKKNSGPVKTTALASRGVLKVRGLAVRLRASPATKNLDSANLARLPRLPDTAAEIHSTALALNADLTTDIFLGAQASEGMVKSMDLSGYKVLAFATHGLVPGDLNGLTQPALALSAPEVANDPNNDGLLTMGEILGLKLNADWVVLSACNTGSGSGAGAEAVSGLGRAFFYAGTRALLVSNWPVETTSAKALTTGLFRRQAEDPTLSRTEALRQTILALIDGPGYVDPTSGKSVFSYAHPIFWAPFSLIGDGGGAEPAS